jgi:hypothetical protein
MLRISKITLTSTLAFVAALTSTSFALADVVPDQEIVNSRDWYSCVSSDSRVAQSFTPTRSGTLTAISLNPFSDNNPGPLVIDIYASANNLPSGASLGTTSIPQSQIPDRNTELGGNPRPVTLITLASPVQVTAGQRYFIAASSPTAIRDFDNDISHSFCLMQEADVNSAEQSIHGDASSWGNLSDNDIDFATYITYSEGENETTAMGLSNTGTDALELLPWAVAFLVAGSGTLLFIRRLAGK